MIRSFAAQVAFLVVSLSGALGTGTFTGPVSPLPSAVGTVNFSQSGQPNDSSLARTGGKYFYYSATSIASRELVYWGPNPNGIAESFVHGTPSGSEIFTLSSLNGGVAVWTGSTLSPTTGSTVYLRFTLTVTNQANGQQLALSPASTVGQGSTVGAVLSVTAGLQYTAHILFEASYSQSGPFSPALEFFDAIPYKSPALSGTAQTSFSSGFYYQNTNTPPTAGTSTATFNTGDTTTLSLPFATTDADGDTVTVQSISVSSGAPFTLGTVTSNTVPVTASLNAAGSGTISFTVTDGHGGTANGSVSVTVIDNLPPVFTNVPSDITVEAPSGAAGAVVNYTAATATDNVGVTSLTVNYPSGSTFPIGQTVVQYTAADAAGNTVQASFNVNVLPGDPSANTLGIKGAAVTGDSVPTGTTWAAFGVPCVTGSGDAFFTAALKAGKVTQKGIVLLDGTTGNATPLVQAGSAVSGLSGVTFSVFKDPLAVSTAGGGEAVAYVATIAGTGVTKSSNQVVVRNWLSSGAIAESDLLAQSGMVIDDAGAEVLKFSSLGLGPDGTVWAFVSLVPGVGGVTTTNNVAVLSWAPGATAPVEVLRRGGSLTLGDGQAHVVNTIASLVSASGSPGQERWEGPEGLIARVGFVDGASAVVTTTSDGTLTELARKGGDVTVLDVTGAEEVTDGQWASFGLPALDSLGGTTFKAALAAKIAGVTSKNALGLFRQDNGSSQWTALVRLGDSTGLSDGSVFSAFNDPVSNGAATASFIATQLAGKLKTTGLWSSSLAGSGPSESRVLTQIAALGQPAPETGGGVFAGFVSVALPEWENAGPLFVATLQTGAHGTAGPGGVTTATKTGLWGVDYNGNLRLLLRSGSPLPGAADGSPVVKTFAVLKAVSGSAGQSRAIDGQREVACNVTLSNGATAVVKIQVP